MAAIADSSLRPIARVRISSSPAAISKRQPWDALTMGTGSRHASLPTSSQAFSPCCTITCFTCQSRWKRSTAVGSIPSGGKKCCQLSPSTSLSAASFCWPIASASAFAACSGVAYCCWAKAASGDSINVNRAIDNGFLILLILSGGVVHGVQKDALWRRRAARGLRWKTDDSAVPVLAALARRGRGFRCR
ncbi:hypothetical protein SB00610_02596 [Klebsiella quasipneumoniae subsp. similipneumoniae]|nr:hypothetical protein SB00610_02596 [Klebsiella quasipneumoniae subsp. similipneumoniae]